MAKGRLRLPSVGDDQDLRSGLLHADLAVAVVNLRGDEEVVQVTQQQQTGLRAMAHEFGGRVECCFVMSPSDASPSAARGAVTGLAPGTQLIPSSVLHQAERGC